MTITSTTFYTDWIATDGVTTDWSYAFTILDAATVEVLVREGLDGAITTYTDNFTFVPTNDSEGYVRFPAVGSALPAGSYVRIQREVPFTQTTRIGAEGAFLPAIHERAFDRLTLQTQQLQKGLSRAVLTAFDETGVTIDKIAEDHWYKVDADGNLVDGGSAADVANAQTNAAQVAADKAIVLAAKAEALGAIPDIKFASVAALRVFAAATTALVATTLGYVAPFERLNGGATYDYDATDAVTADDGILTIVDAAGRRWKQRVDGPLDSLKSGLKTDGSAMDSQMAAFVAAAATLPGKAIRLHPGTYTLLKQVDWSDLDKVQLGSEVVFDFRLAVNQAYFTLGGFVNVIGPALTALPDLAADVTKGSSSLTFASDPALVTNAYICLYNPTDASYQTAAHTIAGSRLYYRAGEWIKISDGSGGTAVKTFGARYAAYAAADVDVYLHPGKKFIIEGGTLTILESASILADAGAPDHENHDLKFIAGLKVERVVESNFDAVRPTNSGYTGMDFTQCINLTGSDYNVNQYRKDGSGNYYGIVESNCQGNRFNGIFRGGRHPFTRGGGDYVGAVPTRDCIAEGLFEVAGAADVGSGVNNHGNCEYCHYRGIFIGGYSGGGNYNSVIGDFIVKEGQNGIAILLSELSGFDHQFGGRIFAPAGDDPNTIGRGTIDCAGNSSTVLNVKTPAGGTLVLDGFQIDAAGSARCVKILNSGYAGAEKLKISMKGLHWKPSSAAGPRLLTTQATSGSNFSELYLDGVQDDNTPVWSVANVTAINGWKAQGKVTVTPPSTAVAVAVQAITMARNAPKTAQFSLIGTATIGGKICALTVSAESNSGATVTARTTDGANFTNLTPATVNWFASVQDL